MPGELLTIEQVADLLNVCPRTAQRFLTGDKLKDFGKITIEIVKFSKRTVRYIVKVSDS